MEDDLQAKIEAVMADPESVRQIEGLLADDSVRSLLASELRAASGGNLDDLSKREQLEAMAALLLSRGLAQDDEGDETDHEIDAVTAAVEAMLADDDGRSVVEEMLENEEFREMLSEQLAQSNPGLSLEDLPQDLCLRLAATAMLAIDAEREDEDGSEE
jgi:hypothetical protein